MSSFGRLQAGLQALESQQMAHILAHGNNVCRRGNAPAARSPGAG